MASEYNVVQIMVFVLSLLLCGREQNRHSEESLKWCNKWIESNQQVFLLQHSGSKWVAYTFQVQVLAWNIPCLTCSFSAWHLSEAVLLCLQVKFSSVLTWQMWFGKSLTYSRELSLQEGAILILNCREEGIYRWLDEGCSRKGFIKCVMMTGTGGPYSLCI